MKISERLLSLLRCSPADLDSLGEEIARAEEQVARLRQLWLLVRVEDAPPPIPPPETIGPMCAPAPAPARPVQPKPARNGSTGQKHREQIREYLLAHGPLSVWKLGTKLGIATGSVQRAVNCSWFLKTEEGIALTEEGRTAAAIPKPSQVAPPKDGETRLRILAHIGAHSPARFGAIADATGISHGSTGQALKHEWFEKTAEGYILSPAGKARYAEIATTPAPAQPPAEDLGDLRRRALRLIATAGPQRLYPLSLALGVHSARAEKVLSHEWFEDEPDGWHLSAKGQLIINAEKEGQG